MDLCLGPAAQNFHLSLLDGVFEDMNVHTQLTLLAFLVHVGRNELTTPYQAYL